MRDCVPLVEIFDEQLHRYPDYWWYRAEEYRAKADSVREFEELRTD
jgi:hypothetical protein